MISPTANLRYNTTEPACTSGSVSAKAQRGGRDFTEAIFLRFSSWHTAWIATLHFPFSPGMMRIPPSTHLLALAPAPARHPAQLHIKAAVDDKFAIAAYQIAILGAMATGK